MQNKSMQEGWVSVEVSGVDIEPVDIVIHAFIVREMKLKFCRDMCRGVGGNEELPN